MSLNTKSNLGVILLLVLASGSQFGKQGLLAGWFDPGVYAGWATAVLASQLLFNFGGLGFHNFSARHAAIYESRGKILLTNSLVGKQLLMYTYMLPISIPVMYFLLAKPGIDLFAIMLFYACVNVFLNAATSPIYVRSSSRFASIQAVRGVGSTIIAVVTCYATDSLFFTLINESLFILILGCSTLKSQKFRWRTNHFKLGHSCKALVPFFLPVLLSTASVTVSRLIAIEFLNDQSLGTYYFMFLVVSCGVMFQYGLSVFFGPIITSKLNNISPDDLNIFIFKCWASVFCIALLSVSLGSIIFPILVDYFYPSYSVGLILMFPILCLAVAKMCDIWSVFFLLAGLEKYLYMPHLASIISAALVYLFVIDPDSMQLSDMRFFLLGEAAAIFFVPLVLFLIIRRDHSRIKLHSQ
ncbi:hypothetical protein N8302_04420 [Gammaproteobacteria bacterium]|nr:hypothetical protein [Gammaproteobacteria bacterium]